MSIRLPDGSLFLTARRLDFVNHADALFVLAGSIGDRLLEHRRPVRRQ